MGLCFAICLSVGWWLPTSIVCISIAKTSPRGIIVEFYLDLQNLRSLEKWELCFVIHTPRLLFWWHTDLEHLCADKGDSDLIILFWVNNRILRLIEILYENNAKLIWGIPRRIILSCSIEIVCGSCFVSHELMIEGRWSMWIYVDDLQFVRRTLISSLLSQF